MKLNWGCGYNIKEGYLNVDIDRHEGVDYLWDLENFPYPWEDDSVDEILMSHILEHLGETTDQYYRIWKEMYRICRNGAEVHIIVPHPKHDHFIGDPSHVRPITLGGIELFSKKCCQEYKKHGLANTRLADYLDVDFEVIKSQIILSKDWETKFKQKEITEEDLNFAINHYNNVIQMNVFVLKVIKE